MQHPYHSNDDASTIGSQSLLGGDDDHSTSNNNLRSLPRIVTAGDELESLCRAEMSGGNATIMGFPPQCLPIVRLLAGNHCCVDCGDEDQGRLKYASLGYGTLLCQECAHRHVTEDESNESNIKSLKDDDWNLRSTLTILEGSNTAMLDYVKHKPRWRPPKGKTSESYSEDVLAFKQIYLSKAAGTYRKNLAKKVDDTFYSRITAMREEDAAKERLVHHMINLEPRDPFQHIFEQNDMTVDEIPGFFENNKTPSNNIDTKAESSPAKTKATVERKGRSNTMSTPLMKHKSPSVDLIKERIAARRSMNPTIAKQEAALDDSLASSGHSNSNESGRNEGGNKTKAIAAGYMPQSNRRRSQQGYNRRGSDYSVGSRLVGEIGDSSIQGHDIDTHTVGSHTLASHSMASYNLGAQTRQQWNQQWNHGPDDDSQSFFSYASRARGAPQLGMYRRVSEVNDGEGQLTAQRRSSDDGGKSSQLVAQPPGVGNGARAQIAARRRSSSGGRAQLAERRRSSSSGVNASYQVVPRRPSNSDMAGQLALRRRSMDKQGPVTGRRPSSSGAQLAVQRPMYREPAV